MKPPIAEFSQQHCVQMGATRIFFTSMAGVSTQTTGHLRMQGKEVFRHAVEKLSNTALEAIEAAGLTTDDVDWIVPHQANQRILEGMSKRLKVPMDRVVMTVNNHGNTSAASIPLAMAVARPG